jgi:CDP-paratose 2-epimerase
MGYKMKTCLITGGVGFLGVNCSLKFLANGWKVIAFDNLHRKGVHTNILNHPNYTFIHGDIRNYSDLKEIDKIDCVLHLAANAGIPWSIKNPRYDFEVNASGTINILEYARIRKIPVIFASTNKVYSDAICDLPLEEKDYRYDFKDEKYKTGITTDFPIDGRGEHSHSPYGCSKASADLYCQEYFHTYGVPTTVFRMSCLGGKYQFGADEQGWFSWFMIAKLLGKPLTIYGNGKQVRDVLYGDDIAELYYLAVTQPENFAGKVFNVGGGPENTVSLLEAIELIDKIDKGFGFNNPPLQYSFADWRLADHRVYYSDIRPLEKLWKPKNGILASFTKTYEWLAKNKDELRKFYD